MPVNLFVFFFHLIHCVQHSLLNVKITFEILHAINAIQFVIFTKTRLLKKIWISLLNGLNVTQIKGHIAWDGQIIIILVTKEKQIAKKHNKTCYLLCDCRCHKVWLIHLLHTSSKNKINQNTIFQRKKNINISSKMPQKTYQPCGCDITINKTFFLRF